MTKDNSTPRPWKIESNVRYDHTLIYPNNDGYAVATAHEDPRNTSSSDALMNAQANARLIIKSVNNHEKLVEALQGMVKHFEDVDEYTRPHAYKWVMRAKQVLSDVESEN